jgi:penicillin-binding protein 2
MSTALGPVPNQHGELPHLRRRLPWLAAAVGVVFLILLGRLWQLQITQGDAYLQKSLDNFVKDVEVPALRGRIKDRRGRVLVDNRPAYNVYITPRFFTQGAMTRMRELIHLDDATAASIWHKVESPRGLGRFREVLVLEDVARDSMAILETFKEELPGVAVEAVPHRNYPHGSLSAHALGFLNEVTTEELQQLAGDGYRVGQAIGRSGLERQWEPFLHGRGGATRVVVDAKGQRKSDEEARELLGNLPKQEPLPGADLVLSLDVDLQQAVEHALDKDKVQAGGVVVLDVETGRILAIASRPDYDPNVLSGRLTRAEDQRLNHDPRRPRMDKVVRENYFPGSTFKVVPALAALEEGLVNPSEKVVCGGGYRFGGRMFHCMEVHGPVDMHDAIVRSCNTYFFKIGERVGMDRMARIAHELGLGEGTGLGLNGEVPGFIPTSEYYRKSREGFHPGSTLNMAIGQGSVKVTLLQMATLYGALANGGRLYVPQLAERLELPDSGKVIETFPPRLRRQVSLRPENLALIRRALAGVVNDTHGTAYAQRLTSVEVAGKTGTAQVHRIKTYGKDHIVAEGEWDTSKDHAWFVGFAPAYRPRIVVAALVEHGGLGAKAAAPVVMQTIRAYFNKVEPDDARAPAASARPRAPLFDDTPVPVNAIADEPSLPDDEPAAKSTGD